MNTSKDFSEFSRSHLKSFPSFVKRAFNFSAALALIVLGSPLLIGIALLILAIDGRPILHKGKRLGRHKHPFTMYKFRTLKRGATGVLGTNLVSFNHRVVLPCGRFLRDSRLDELPQLVNILKGNMIFFGPRPERPEVYKDLCSHLEGYDHRFSIKPGLVGYAQLFTPHSSPKRLRTLADRIAMRNITHPFQKMALVIYAIVSGARTATSTVLHYLWVDLLQSKILRLYRSRREWVRVRPRDVKIRIDLGNRTIEAPIVDINNEAVLLESPEQLPQKGEPLVLRMEVQFQRRQQGSSTRTRTAHCSGRLFQTRRTPKGCQHVILYRPATAWSQYLIHQYILRRSLANPFRPMGNGNSPGSVAKEGKRPGLKLSSVAGGRDHEP